MAIAKSHSVYAGDVSNSLCGNIPSRRIWNEHSIDGITKKACSSCSVAYYCCGKMYRNDAIK